MGLPALSINFYNILDVFHGFFLFLSHVFLFQNLVAAFFRWRKLLPLKRIMEKIDERTETFDEIFSGKHSNETIIKLLRPWKHEQGDYENQAGWNDGLLAYLVSGAKDKLWNSRPSLAAQLFYSASKFARAMRLPFIHKRKNLASWEKVLRYLVKVITQKKSDGIEDPTDEDLVVTKLSLDQWKALYMDKKQNVDALDEMLQSIEAAQTRREKEKQHQQLIEAAQARREKEKQLQQRVKKDDGKHRKTSRSSHRRSSSTPLLVDATEEEDAGYVIEPKNRASSFSSGMVHR